MKKITIVSIFSFVFWILSSISAIIISHNYEYSALGLVLIGIVILALNRFVYFLLDDFGFSKYLTIIINAIAMGFCILGLFKYKEINISFLQMFLSSIICTVYLILFHVLLNIKLFERNFKKYLIIFLIISGLLFLYIIISNNSLLINTIGLYGFLAMAFIFVLSIDSKTYKELSKNITLATFSVFFIVIIILLGMLELDGADALDLGVEGGKDPEISSPKNIKLKDVNKKKKI